jgi:hypothetical protein
VRLRVCLRVCVCVLSWVEILQPLRVDSSFVHANLILVQAGVAPGGIAPTGEVGAAS